MYVGARAILNRKSWGIGLSVFRRVRTKTRVISKLSIPATLDWI